METLEILWNQVGITQLRPKKQGTRWLNIWNKFEYLAKKGLLNIVNRNKISRNCSL